MELEDSTSWQTRLDEFLGQFASRFQRSETRESVRNYVRGLLADVQRKNGWQLAEEMGLSDPHPIQRLLNEAKWTDEEVRKDLRRSIIEAIGYEPGIGVLDESGFIKWGQKSAGVSRQYCGRIGKVDNCQVGVYLGYVTPTGAAFLDGQLYLPQVWCEDRERCREAKIPDEIPFQTKLLAETAQPTREGQPQRPPATPPAPATRSGSWSTRTRKHRVRRISDERCSSIHRIR
jgi:SRSO17 transposase